MWLLASCKNGISSYEVGRALGVTAAHRMVHDAPHPHRRAGKLADEAAAAPATPVEVDETFIGGKARNMHKE